MGCALAALLALSGCGGNDASVGSGTGATEPAVDVTGAWAGKWLSRTGAGGASKVTFTQRGSAVSGDFRFTGSPCFSAGRFEGTLTGGDLSGAITAGGIRVELSATVTASSIDGTYDAVSAGACTGDTGTFSATR
jgi:hypothetical protein